MSPKTWAKSWREFISHILQKISLHLNSNEVGCDDAVDDGPPTCSLSQSMFCASSHLKKVMEHTHPYLIIVRYSMVIVWYCVVLPLLRYAHRPHHSLTLSSTTQIFLDPTHSEKEMNNFPLPCPTKILK